jgi:hypothetical protein
LAHPALLKFDQGMRERDRVHKLPVLIRSIETCMYIYVRARNVPKYIERKERREGSTRAPRPGSISETGGREVDKDSVFDSAWRSGRRLQKGSPARPSTSTSFLPVVDQSAHLEKTKSQISAIHLRHGTPQLRYVVAW